MPVEGIALMELFTHAASLADGLGAAAGLAAGLASSAHCAVMCGPLACTAGARAAESPLVVLGRRRNPWAAPAAYHAGRIAAYGSVGAALGVAGEGARHLLSGIGPALPWVMAGALAASAFGLGKHIPVPAPLRRLAQPLVRKSANLAPTLRAAAIGAATPLLPCASLYGLFVAAVATSSALGGAALMMAFAIGATPALALVQAHAPLLGRHPRVSGWLRRAVPLLAAAVLVWRAVHSGAGSMPPMCH
jgi:sulfite exporter TauE/SafE